MAIVADLDLQDDWLLVFPDGSNRLTIIDEDDSFEVTPHDMAEIERARVPSHRAARSDPCAHGRPDAIRAFARSITSASGARQSARR